MAIDLIKEFEEIPDEYPTVTPLWRVAQLDTDAPVLDAQVWQRNRPQLDG